MRELETRLLGRKVPDTIRGRQKTNITSNTMPQFQADQSPPSSADV
jgi:hypothetical protein